MQFFRLTDNPFAEVRQAFSVVLATREGALGRTSRCLNSFGGKVDVLDEAYDALSLFGDDPRAADLLVLDCDGFGGLSVGKRLIGQMPVDDRRAPVILVTATCPEQSFPYRREMPIVLRAPVSSVAMRLALETSLKGRIPGFAMMYD